MDKITRTISIDLDIWKEAKKYAIDHNETLSSMIEKALEKEMKTKKGAQ